MLKIEGKTFMNIQEAVQWLLENNALPYQSTANYVANTEIAMSTLVDPSPAKIRVGSLVFFADSKVSTVTGITSNGFIVSDQYNNLVDDIAYVTGVAINASGHLITTLSDEQTIDAGQIKQVSGFTINASQHLIVSYNDGTTNDLGAIFSGSVNISGNLSVSGSISGNEIVENMAGYSFDIVTVFEWDDIYVGAVKNGNKLTLVVFGEYTKRTESYAGNLGYFTLPQAVADKIIPYSLGTFTDVVDTKISNFYDDIGSSVPINLSLRKANPTQLMLAIRDPQNLTADTTYLFRYEVTFLLGTNLAS